MSNDIYENKARNMRVKNVEDVLKNIDEYQNKLIKYADRFDMELEYLQQEIWNDIFLINYISKDPTRQNFQEDIAKEYILENYPDFQNFEILPKNTNDSLYLTNGQIISKSDLSTNNHTKSIDFKWEYNGYIIYATHKYTKDSGGAQDNQYKDVIYFLNHAKQNTKSHELFVAICDGEYYQKGDNFKNLIKSVLNTKCTVCTLETLKEEIDKLIDFLK